MYNFDRVQNLSQSINNDLEAMSNFTQGSPLAADIKMAILNRINVIKKEAEAFNKYIEDHKNFNKVLKDFNTDYSEWFKMVEPEIALKKIQFEKSSQSLVYSIIGLMTLLLGSIALGVK